jgi:hypothetical protein
MSNVMEAGGAAAADKGKMIYSTDLIEPIQCHSHASPALSLLLTLANEPADLLAPHNFHAHGFILFTAVHAYVTVENNYGGCIHFRTGNLGAHISCF